MTHLNDSRHHPAVRQRKCVPFLKKKKKHMLSILAARLIQYSSVLMIS